MERKKEWKRDFDALRRDQTFNLVKPFSTFIQFEDCSRRFYDNKIKSEVEQFTKLLNSVRDIFCREKMKHEMRYKEVAKVLEASGKKDPHLYDLHKAIQVLMIAIVERSK